MRFLCASTVAVFLATSCTLTIRHDQGVVGAGETSVSLTIAPLVTIKRVDTLPNGESHYQSFFAVAPVPDNTTTTTTTVGDNGKPEVVKETKTTQAPTEKPQEIAVSK